MKRSSLQFDNPRLMEIQYKVNEQYVFEDEIELETFFNVQIERDEQAGIALVALNVELFNKSDFEKVPFSLTMKIQAHFSWQEDMEPKKLDILLNSNAPAILLSYIRPFITQFTVFSEFPPLVLPIFSFAPESKL